MPDDTARTEANRLYWGSDASVAEIAEQLGISRRALYDAIEPRPAGLPCPACGGALGYRNRTAAERWEATCAGCGQETTTGREARGGGIEPPEAEQEREAARLSPVDPGRLVVGPETSMVGGALLAGVVAGALAGLLLRRL